jgi:hypothetical protein
MENNGSSIYEGSQAHIVTTGLTIDPVTKTGLRDPGLVQLGAQQRDIGLVYQLKDN